MFALRSSPSFSSCTRTAEASAVEPRVEAKRDDRSPNADVLPSLTSLTDLTSHSCPTEPSSPAQSIPLIHALSFCHSLTSLDFRDCFEFRAEFEALAHALPLCSSLTTFKIAPRPGPEQEQSLPPPAVAVSPMIPALAACKTLTAVSIKLQPLRTAEDLVVIELLSTTHPQSIPCVRTQMGSLAS